MSSELWTTYSTWSYQTEKTILNWIDGSLNYKLSPTKDWPMASFQSAFLVIIIYVSFVIIGTILMKMGLPAMNTRALQFIYNPIQIILCSYMCVEAGVQAYRNGYSIFPCNPFKIKNPVMGNILWLFYISKILDFCDTFFIIVNKKWNQLSFLHVYHHLTIFAMYWLNLRMAYDGDIYFTIVLNGFIHTIMYTYYFISAHTKNIWWKKYLTGMQMIQFLLMNYQGYLMSSSSCSNFPKKIPIIYLYYIQSLFWLFLHFFISSYCSKPKPKKE